MTRTSATGARGSTFTLALAAIGLRAVSGIATALRNRRAVRELVDLDDRSLKDIGLMRTDVAAALDRPLHHDPSLHLVAVAGHGRTGRPRPAPAEAMDSPRVRRGDAPMAGTAPVGC
jgi:uncharacterized protein YjiS (DUF1127 family)